MHEEAALQRHSSRPVLRILAAALAAAAIAAPAAAENPGAYLAAEHAARQGDVGAAADYYARALAQDPSNRELLERTILTKVAAGRIEGAIPLARRLAETEPGHQLASLVLAADALKIGRMQEVRDIVAAIDSENGQFLNSLIDAWAAFGAGAVDEARATLNALEEDSSAGGAGQLMAAYHLGLVETAAGDDAAAVEAFARANERAGTPTTRLVRIHAGALARLGRIEEARALIAERLGQTLGDDRLEALDRDLAEGRVPAPVVTTAPAGTAQAFFGIAGFLSRGPNQTVGLAYARIASHLDPDLIEAKLLTAQLLRAGEQYDLAIAAYEAVPRDAPEALEAMIGRAEVMQLDGRAEPAIVAMREVAARYPRSIEAQNALGDMLRRESRFEEAAVAYDATINLLSSIEPQHWVLFYQRGIAYERSDQWELAEADFRKALELEPDQPFVLNYLGYSWVEMGRNLEDAQAMIEKAVEQRPEDGYIVDSLGWVLFRLGDFDGAAKHLERAVELRPVDPVINDHFGDALWMIGRRTEARFQWKRALSFEPEEEDVERIRRKLEVGLDTVLAEEEAAGEPAIIGAATDRKGG
jgi:Flp pilus assembly protein TadD